MEVLSYSLPALENLIDPLDQRYLLFRALALRCTLACGVVNSGSMWVQMEGNFTLFQTGVLKNHDSKLKIEENNFYLSHNFL